MTLVEALLLLPECGEPTAVRRDIAAELSRASARFVCRGGARWALTDGGRRFLAQFREDAVDAVQSVLVTLVRAADGPLFHLLCDEAVVLKVAKPDLRRKLHEIRAVNPDVRIAFDFRRSDRVR